MFDDKTYQFFSKKIYDLTGMIFEEKDYYRLDARIKELLRFFEFANVEELIKAFENSPSADMQTILINISTNNETYFFRDKKPFEALSEYIYPEVKKMVKFGRIELWNAACSTGQEVYSVLMCLEEKFGEEALKSINITATDISSRALEKAVSGTYTSLEVQRGMPIETLMKYFKQDEAKNWVILDKFKTYAKFSKHNLLKDKFPVSKYHIIFCRNVLIYQNKENKNEILKQLYEALKPGGFLVLGNGESLIGMDTAFEKDSTSLMTLYRRPF